MACKVTARGARKCAQLLDVGTRSQCSPALAKGEHWLRVPTSMSCAHLRAPRAVTLHAINSCPHHNLCYMLYHELFLQHAVLIQLKGASMMALLRGVCV